LYVNPPSPDLRSVEYLKRVREISTSIIAGRPLLENVAEAAPFPSFAWRRKPPRAAGRPAAFSPIARQGSRAPEGALQARLAPPG
jgi:hypothetical protein